jgi:hypothetical protein
MLIAQRLNALFSPAVEFGCCFSIAVGRKEQKWGI